MDNKILHRGDGNKRDYQYACLTRKFDRGLNSPKQSKAKAFTLAEVLITLVIVGVVASLTIPSVIVSYKKHQTVTKLKKVYTTLSQTTNMAIADWGPIKGWEFSGSDTKGFVDKYIAPYLNVAKNCGYDTTGACEFTYANMKTPNSPNPYDNTYYKLILSDGSAIFFKNISQNYIGAESQRIYQDATSIDVDINGQKGPNVYGKDIFMYVYWVKNTGSSEVDGKFVANCAGTNREKLTTKHCNTQKSGQCCAALIMLDGWQMKDYYPW